MEGSLVAYQVFTNGSTLQASELNENLMQQSIATFSNSAARTAAITSPVEGQMTYLLDLDVYESWSGSAWVSSLPMGAWTAFTPTWSGLTVGNGVYNKSHFYISGKIATINIDFSLGSTSAVTGNLSFTVPVSLARSSTFNTGLAQLLFVDASVTTYLGIPLPSTSNSQLWNFRGTSGDPVVIGSTSSSAPFTWTTGDRIVFGATYEVA
jgi:hypothetical protein